MSTALKTLIKTFNNNNLQIENGSIGKKIINL
jgi:hypothetical protein